MCVHSRHLIAFLFVASKLIIMLVFDAAAHSYKNPFTGEIYISATTLIGKFKKPFDVEAISKRIAEREGVSPEEIKRRWKKINNDSKEYGQTIHGIVEEYNKTKTIVDGYEDLIKSYNKLGVLSEQDELLVEEKVFNHEYKLAGTADIIRIEDGGGFSVFDLKTNKKFNLYNTYSEYLMNPLSHLTSCEYTTYGLQLSLYAFMFQCMTGRKVNQLGVFYYDRKHDAFTYYPVPYMKTDVKEMLHYAQANFTG